MLAPRGEPVWGRLPSLQLISLKYIYQLIRTGLWQNIKRYLLDKAEIQYQTIQVFIASTGAKEVDDEEVEVNYQMGEVTGDR